MSLEQPLRRPREPLGRRGAFRFPSPFVFISGWGGGSAPPPPTGGFSHLPLVTEESSLNVDLEGAHVEVCFLYPPDSVHRQIMRTALLYKGGVAPETAAPEQEILALHQRAEETGLFVSAGRELKCPLSRPFTPDEMDLLV